MKKVLALMLVCVFAFSFAVIACDDDEDSSACTEDDAEQCANDYIECAGECADAACAEDCAADWCDCLDSQGCDEYLDDAGC